MVSRFYLRNFDLKTLEFESTNSGTTAKFPYQLRECRAPRSKEGQFRNQDNTRKQGNNKDTSSNAMLAIDSVGFVGVTWQRNKIILNMALMDFSDSEINSDYHQKEEAYYLEHNTILVLQIVWHNWSFRILCCMPDSREAQWLLYLESSKAGSELLNRYNQKKSVKYCIVMPIWKDTLYFDSPTKDVDNGKKPKTADDVKALLRWEQSKVRCTGYRQEEELIMEEVFAPLARIEAIRLFLAYASLCVFWFKRGKIDQTLFIKKQKGDILLVQVYVDDIIFGSTNKELCTGFEKLMKDKFQMSSMGELTFFLGLQVQQKEDGIFISQDKYVAEILKKFNYSDVKSASTLVDLEKPLVKDGDADDVDVHLYRSMIGSLMYLTASRPDIMFAVCACARFQVTPKTSHLLAVKRIFRYLKGKPTLGLWYSRDSPFELVAYTDSDYAGATLDRKSTTGGCQFLGNRLISWQCKKQTVVATFTTEA
ncbi:putative ribonuclease H-like domain-containing protein [Tanacetum coccineum]